MFGNTSMVHNQDFAADDKQQKSGKSENLAGNPNTVLNCIHHIERSVGMVDLPQIGANQIQNKLLGKRYN